MVVFLVSDVFRICGSHVLDLLYTDDPPLVCHSADGLQRSQDAVSLVYRRGRLIINIDETQVL